jgi:tetratricopeptide (TPR) repeat protein
MSTPHLQRAEQPAYANLTFGDAIGLTAKEISAVESAGDSLRREGRLENALQLWGALLTCDPYAPRPWREVAQLQQRLGQHVEAVAAFEMLARVADREPEATYREALSCFALGQHELARQLLDHALELNDDHANTWVNHARQTLEKVR